MEYLPTNHSSQNNAEEADIRVFQTHNGGDMIPGVSLRYPPGSEPLAFARAFDLSGRAAVIGGGHRDIEGNQPERLNAEGFSPSALSRGWSFSATLGMPYAPRKASKRRESSRKIHL